MGANKVVNEVIEKQVPSLAEISRGFASIAELSGYLRIQILDYCNEKCFFCHNEGSEVGYRKIDEEMMWKAIDASVSLGKLKIGFTGGEPTLHPKFSQYLLQLRERLSLVTHPSPFPIIRTFFAG